MGECQVEFTSDPVEQDSIFSGIAKLREKLAGIRASFTSAIYIKSGIAEYAVPEPAEASQLRG